MNQRATILTIFLLISVLIFSGFGCRAKPQDKVTLVFWNLWDDSDTWKELISAYEATVAADKTKALVKIQYYKRSYDGYERYEQELNDAVASGQAPDIFAVNNTWIGRYKNKISPLDGGARLVKDFQRNFVDAVSEDFLIDDKIYGIPSSVDSMALYYNQDIFNAAGIYDPPKTWDEFKDDVQKLTIFDEKGDIIRAGAAIGFDKNVNRSTDILNLLMLQSGSDIVDAEHTKAVFADPLKDKDNKVYSVGGMALQFYTDFANPAKKAYTWNPNMDYSIDMFYQGRAAMMFNYSYHIATIRAKAPKLKFAVAPMPQISGATLPVNYSNYWASSVSVGSKHPKEAWDFLMFISNPEIAKKYLTKANKPTAHRDLVNWQESAEDLDMAVFARQALTAKNWYQADSMASETILAEAIKSVVLGKSTPEDAGNLAAAQITEIMRRK